MFKLDGLLPLPRDKLVQDKDLLRLSIDATQNVTLFQEGKIAEKEQQWHKLVSPELREALSINERKRQSIMFEILKSERGYVADLEAAQEVFCKGFRNTYSPAPYGTSGHLPLEVFDSLNKILLHHQRMLASLLSCQREQHPLLTSICDIILTTILKPDFYHVYTVYIEHYPLTLFNHQRELKRNKAYSDLVLSVTSPPTPSSGPPPLSKYPKNSKILLSRPVARLAQLGQLLSTLLQVTQSEEVYVFTNHPDLQTLPLILEIFEYYARKVQPGVEHADGQAKLLALRENIVNLAGEIGQLDLFEEGRILLYEGHVAMYNGTESDPSELVSLRLFLFDNNLLMIKEAKQPDGTIKHILVDRPISLLFLSLGSFTSPCETWRKKIKDKSSLRSSRCIDVSLYPFTVFHASAPLERQYKLYVTSDVLRRKWRNVLTDAIEVYRAKMEGNMRLLPYKFLKDIRVLNSGCSSSASTPAMGRYSCATLFDNGGEQFIALGCMTGIYVSRKEDNNFRRVLSYNNPTSMVAIKNVAGRRYNLFLVHHKTSLFSMPLDLLAHVAVGLANPTVLESSIAKVVDKESELSMCGVQCFRHAKIGNRVLFCCISKVLGTSLRLNVLEALDIARVEVKQQSGGAWLSAPFIPLGKGWYIPKDAYDIATIGQTVGVCTHAGIVIINPITSSTIAIVPDLSINGVTGESMANLREKVRDAKALGFVKCNQMEVLVIYDTIGFYINRHGIPSRSTAYVTWETPATSFAHRGPHVLLFSSSFIEIRDVATMKLVQVMEGTNVTLLDGGQPSWEDEAPVLVAIGGDQDGSTDDSIIELKETVRVKPIVRRTISALWEEWYS